MNASGPAAEPRIDWFAKRVRDEEAPQSAPQDDPDAGQIGDDLRAVKLVETEGRIFQARLSYDPIEADVFVEILDPTTGDVVRRLPAEKAAEESCVLKKRWLTGQLVRPDCDRSSRPREPAVVWF